MQVKKCTKCGVEKELREFSKCKANKDGLQFMCKVCRHLNYLDNKEKVSEYGTRYYVKNKDMIDARHARDYIKNRPARLVKGKLWRSTHKEYISKYNEENKEIIARDKLENQRARLASDPQFKMERNLRRRLHHAIVGQYKSGSAVRDCGCTMEALKYYLELRFQPGMTWDNYGRAGWHIDHIRPLASFDLTDRNQLLAAVHYSNLQPLWASDNLQKGASLDWHKE